jgi:fructose-specific phosphotransferase system component IIB
MIILEEEAVRRYHVVVIECNPNSGSEESLTDESLTRDREATAAVQHDAHLVNFHEDGPVAYSFM